MAKAITTIDQLSGGRAHMGIGAGWAKVEYDAYGIPFPEPKVRLDQLEEGIQVLRGMLLRTPPNAGGGLGSLAESVIMAARMAGLPREVLLMTGPA